MLCHDYRCIFVHVPKTAGQSIEHVFVDLLGLTWATRAPLLLRHNADPGAGPPRMAHLRAADYLAYGYVDQRQFRDYFKFSFVRNPWDRIVSEYRYKYARWWSFKSFLFKHLPRPGWSDAYNHIVPQHEFLCDAQGNCLLDFVGRYETLQADFDAICAMLQIPQRRLPRINASGKRAARRSVRAQLDQLVFLLRNRQPQRHFQQYTAYYDDESREFVADLYRRDIELFGYAFEPAPAVPVAAGCGKLAHA